jgi:hypothetical protein
LARIRLFDSSANTRGSRSPAIIASTIASDDFDHVREATEVT